MHELSVVFNIISTLEDVTRENKLTEISKVVLELGEVSTVIPDYLTDCWNYMRKKNETIKNSELVIERLPAETYCENCGKTYPTVKYAKICPYCKSDKTYLLRGNEFNIKEIEAR